MKINKIYLKNFKKFKDDEFEFNPGLNIVIGPNESGKSTLINAILYGLFGDASSRSKEIVNLKRWKTDEFPYIKMELSEDKERVDLIRDFNSKDDKFISNLTNSSITSKDKIKNQMLEFCGFDNDKLYKESAAIEQGRIISDLKMVGEYLIKALMGVQANPNKLKKSLEDEILELKKGLKSLAKNPGKIALLKEKIQKNEEGLEISRAQINNARNAIVQLPKLKEELTKIANEEIAVQSDYDSINPYYKKLKKYTDAHGFIEQKQSRQKQLADEKKKIEKLVTEISKLEAKLNKNDYEIAKSINQLIDDQKKEQDINSEKSKNLNKIKKLEEQINTQNKDLSKTVFITQKEYNEVHNLFNEVKTLESILSNNKINFKIEPKKTIIGTLGADDLEREISTNKIIEGSFNALLNLEITDILKLSIEKKDLQEKLDGLNQKRTILKNTLNDYKVKDISGIEELLKNCIGIEQKINELGIEIKVELGDETIDSLKESFENSTKKFDKLNNQILEQRTKINNADIENIIEEYENYEKELRIKQETLSSVSEGRSVEKINLEMDEIINEIKDKNKELNKIIIDLEVLEKGLSSEVKTSLKKIESDEEKAWFLEAKIDEIDKKLRNFPNKKVDIKNEFNRCEVDLKNIPSEETLSDLEEEIINDNNELKRLQKRLDILETAKSILEEAQNSQIQETFSSSITGISNTISQISNNRYKEIQLDILKSEIPNITIRVPETNDFVSFEELSQGTIDLIYLASRIVFANMLSENKNPPILMDEPFYQFDSNRFQKGLEVLEKLSNLNQIIIFTCDEEYLKIKKANIIKLLV